MNSRLLVNLVLLVVVLLLVTLVIFQPGKEDASPDQLLTSLTADQVSNIRIVNKKKQTIELSRQQQAWLMTGPVTSYANEVRVNALLGIVQAKSQARLDANSLSLDSFGLSEPDIILSLNDLDLLIGAIDPLDGRRYVQIGDTVHLIVDRFYHHLIARYTDYVSLQLFPDQRLPGQRSPGRRSLVGVKMPDLTVERGGDGWLVNGQKTDKSSDVLQSFVEAWAHASAIRVSPYRSGETNGELEIRFQLAPEQPGFEPAHIEIIRFEIVRFDGVGEGQGLVLARPDVGLQYHFTAEQAESLLHFPDTTITGDTNPAEDDSPGGNSAEKSE